MKKLEEIIGKKLDKLLLGLDNLLLGLILYIETNKGDTKMGYKTYAKLGNKSVEEAKEDLRRFNDPTSLSYKDNWVAKALSDKYGMDTIALEDTVKEIVISETFGDLKEEADLNNELYRRGEIR